MDKQQFLDLIENLNNKALDAALVEEGIDSCGDLSEDQVEVLDELQTDFFFEDFSDWFRGMGSQYEVIELLTTDEECRSRLIELTSGYDLVDSLFEGHLLEGEEELFPS
jgi:hypothetical protein